LLALEVQNFEILDLDQNFLLSDTSVILQNINTMNQILIQICY